MQRQYPKLSIHSSDVILFVYYCILKHKFYTEFLQRIIQDYMMHCDLSVHEKDNFLRVLKIQSKECFKSLQ
jgi:hypothetical protein